MTRPRFALARFAVNCPTSACRLEERSPRFATGVAVAAVFGATGGEVDCKRGDSETVFVVSTDVGSKGVISEAGTGLGAVSNAAGK